MRALRGKSLFQSTARLLPCPQRHPASTRNAKSESPPLEPTQDREPAPFNFQQNIEVSVQDGRAVTRIAEVGNEPWLKMPMLPEDTLICRQVFFKDKIVPDHYAQLMQRREQEAQCEHLLEGEPIDAWPFI